MSKKLTKNCNTDIEMVTAIFNAVRNGVSYTFYYNTKKGAKKTMDTKSGNCVDKIHLLIALLRAVGIPARYVNCEAKFTSGNTYGHV